MSYRYIPEEQKQLVLTMSLRGMRVKDIVKATGICRRTVARIKGTWKSTGEVVRKSLENGRPRVLSSLEVSYLESLVERTPDIYGRELQYALFVAYNVDVDVSTITRALHRRGFTRKKVSFLYVNIVHC
ncbi:Homeodomain-like protein [Flammula alnicola]|nr:Homeodomain-like protein [Flammula alnicola]